MDKQFTASGLGITIGCEVERVNEYGQLKEWEVTAIDPDGACIEIENDDWEYMYIMADDCVLLTPSIKDNV